MSASVPRSLLLLACWLAAVVPVLAQDEPSAAGERVMRLEVVVEAPPEEVWKAFTTAEGIRGWMAPVAEVDLRLGGTIKTHDIPFATLGEPGTVVQRVLSFEPGRMLSLRTEEVPEDFPYPDVLAALWGVLSFDPESGERTRVRLASMGWGEGPDWEEAWRFFQGGNAATLDALAQRFRTAEGAPALRDEAGGEEKP